MANEILRLQITDPISYGVDGTKEYAVVVHNPVGNKNQEMITFLCHDKEAAMKLHNALLFNSIAFTID